MALFKKRPAARAKTPFELAQEPPTLDSLLSSVEVSFKSAAFVKTLKKIIGFYELADPGLKVGVASKICANKTVFDCLSGIEKSKIQGLFTPNEISLIKKLVDQGASPDREPPKPVSTR